MALGRNGRTMRLHSLRTAGEPDELIRQLRLTNSHSESCLRTARHLRADLNRRAILHFQNDLEGVAALDARHPKVPIFDHAAAKSHRRLAKRRQLSREEIRQQLQHRRRVVSQAKEAEHELREEKHARLKMVQREVSDTLANQLNLDSHYNISHSIREPGKPSLAFRSSSRQPSKRRGREMQRAPAAWMAMPRPCSAPSADIPRVPSALPAGYFFPVAVPTEDQSTTFSLWDLEKGRQLVSPFRPHTPAYSFARCPR